MDVYSETRKNQSLPLLEEIEEIESKKNAALSVREDAIGF